MGLYAKKGICSNCKVCKAYLREADRDQVKHVLSIRWQPDTGRICSEFVDTTPQENDIRSAVAALEKILTPEGVRVVLEIFPPTIAVSSRKTVSIEGIRVGAYALDYWLKPGERQNERFLKFKEVICIKGGKPTLTPLAEKVFRAGLLAVEKLLQTGGGLSGCPAA